ncbi:thioesterase domain-containing protein [Sphingomonas daechungensis]|uniref:thioesterase domain-containing protein n=1 Tax=Sphingomonas daechungensis TaxID=1176646 RepID=UPI0037835064
MTRALPRVFLLPGIGGDEPGLANLRSELADSADFVLVDHPDIDRPSAEIRDFAGIVARAVARIHDVEPSGKVNIAGYSFGAQVAFAAACELQEQGREVGLLALFDSRALSLSVAGRRVSNSDEASGPVRTIADVASRLLIAGGLAEPLRRAIPAVGSVFGKPASLGLRRLLLQNLRGRSLAGHRTGHFDGTIVLFRAGEQHIAGLPHDLGWSAHCAEVRGVELRGGHNSLFRAENLAENAALIRSAIARPLSAGS